MFSIGKQIILINIYFIKKQDNDNQSTINGTEQDNIKYQFLYTSNPCIKY